MNISSRKINSLLFLFSLCILGLSLLLQYGYDLTPCPLCLLARGLVFILVILFGLAALHNPGKRGLVVYSITAFTTALLGIAINARHIWILNLPAEKVPACTPGLDYLLDTLPILEAILVVLNGSGECAKSDDVILFLSLPTWSLLAFIVMAITCLLPIFWQKKG